MKAALSEIFFDFQSAFSIPKSTRGLVGRRQRRAELFEHAARVGVEQVFDSLGVVRGDDEADVVALAQAEDYLGVVISRRVGPLLTSERDDDAGVVFARRGRFVAPVLARDFDARP